MTQLYTSRLEMNKYSIKKSHRNDTDARTQIPRGMVQSLISMSSS